MPYLRVELLGSGTADDPHHCDLENYALRQADYVNMRAIVEVHDMYMPDNWRQIPDSRVIEPAGRRIITNLTLADLQNWHAKLRANMPLADRRLRPGVR